MAGDGWRVIVSGVKFGCQGRPVPGMARVELVAFDPVTGEIMVDDNGYARRCADNEVGLLIGSAGANVDLSRGGLRGVFEQEDSWLPTENLFRRDSDGDYWLADRIDTVIRTRRGPVFTQPIVDVLNDIAAVDMEVAYALPARDRVLAVAAVSVRPGFDLGAADVTEALRSLPPGQRPDVVYVVDDIPRSPSFRPSAHAVQETYAPRPGPHTWWYNPDSEAYEDLTDVGSLGLLT